MSKHLVLKLSAALWLLSFTVCAQIAPQGNSMAVPEHPRILMPEGEESVIKQTIASDITWKTTNQFILDECNKLIGKPPVERILIGRRLLDKSREALRRIFFLSYAWRMASDAKYLKCAEKSY